MSSAPTAKGFPPPHQPSVLAAVLSYLVPGLGQIYQGRYGKGVLFMVSLLGMFMLGQAMGQWQNVYLPREREGNARARGIAALYLGLFNRWQYGGQVWIGIAAWPALYHSFQTPPRQEAGPRDDELPFWRKYQTEPDEAKVNEFLVNSDKTPDLGWVYTVIAGMLNILVIYDAYAGPMFIPLPRLAPKDTAAAKTEAKKEGAA
jgi:hypothetical protein